ncbi:hypothetical protein ACFQZ4_45500 [Catellatospora coxensis]|uniref:Uncharacterized protein n=1 Tax=Catellatospora coxensis TaxID=310354 RepID=A0A8J3PAG6_9ACTN|nr:hypothetical protein [Catellatospora coxensis]GIG10291.1 hypothetical protein Cco03nite_69910 [Catellatospora coxensis]
MSTYLVLAAAAVAVSLATLLFLGRRIVLTDDVPGPCRLDPSAPAGAAWCAHCGA